MAGFWLLSIRRAWEFRAETSCRKRNSHLQGRRKKMVCTVLRVSAMPCHRLGKLGQSRSPAAADPLADDLDRRLLLVQAVAKYLLYLFSQSRSLPRARALSALQGTPPGLAGSVKDISGS